MTGTLILFTRFPVPGQTKTRLAPGLGPDGAAELHRTLVEHSLNTAKTAVKEINIELEIHHTGDEEPMRQWLGNDLVYCEQNSGDLGERMLSSMELVSSPVVLMGTDCPAITAETLLGAFEVLKNQQVVLGPAADGGYYLIGMQLPLGEVFRDMP